MAERLPATRNGGGRGGPARGYSWEPFTEGHTLSRRHGVYAEKFQPLERQEIAETAESLRELLPLYSPSFEPAVQLLAGRLWRIQKAYAFIDEHAEEDVPHSLLKSLAALENTVSRDFEALGLSPRACVALGIDVHRLAAASGGEDEFDLSKLSAAERRTLSKLLEKGAADA